MPNSGKILAPFLTQYWDLDRTKIPDEIKSGAACMGKFGLSKVWISVLMGLPVVGAVSFLSVLIGLVSADVVFRSSVALSPP